MKAHTSGFKTQLKTLGRELDVQITYGVQTLDMENLNYVKPRFNTELFKTVMKFFEFDSNVKIDSKQWIGVQIGIKVDDEYEYLDFGSYYINDEPEFNVDTSSYIYKAYDKMIESMIYYDENPLEISYPITYKNLLIGICDKLGWSYELPLTFPNMDTEIEKDLYIGLGLTYRDILDDLAPASMGNFINDGKFKIIYPTETSDSIDDEFLKGDNISVGKKVNTINALVLSRAENGDTINRRDEDSIDLNGLSEINIKDNILLSTEYREDFIDEMFDKIKGLEYYSIDVASTGVLYYDPLDKFTINHNGVNYPTIALNSEINIEGGIEELLYTPELDEAVTDYSTSSPTDKARKIATIIAYKNQAKINLTAQELTEEKSKIANLEITTNGLELDIRQTGNNLLKGTMFYNMDDWICYLGKTYLESDTVPTGYPRFTYWYCTTDIDTGTEEYLAGVMYQWNSDEPGGTLYWTETDLLRKDLDRNFSLLTNTEIIDTTNSSKTAISGKYIKLYNTGGLNAETPYLIQSLQPIATEKEKLVFSYNLINNIEYGTARVSLIFYQNNDFLTSVGGTIKDYKSYNYFLNSEDGLIINDITIAEDANFVGAIISLNKSFLEIESETTPSSEHEIEGSLWGKVSTDELFICVYEDGEFKEWKKIDIAYSDAIAQSGEETTFVYPKGDIQLYDIKLEYGTYTEWCPNWNENYGANFLVNAKGIQFKKGDNETFIDEDEFSGYYQDEKIFGINRDSVITKKLIVEEIDLNGIDVEDKIKNNDLYNDGWIINYDLWTYASSTTITVPAGALLKYSKGDKIRLKQGGSYKYFYIVGVADTLLTITGGSDYSLTNAAITDVYYSHDATPIGFPTSFAYACVVTAPAGTTPPTYSVNDCRFSINGGIVVATIRLTNATGGTSGAGGGELRFSLPVSSANLLISGIGIFYEADIATIKTIFARYASASLIYAHDVSGNNVSGNDQSSINRYVGFNLTYTIL